MQQSFTFGPSFEPANTLAKSLVIRLGGGAAKRLQPSPRPALAGDLGRG
jgi:hypothetical protein